MGKVFQVLLLSFVFSSCEKDDICDRNTPTTPKVVIEFYDNASPTTLKNITKLKVDAAGFTTQLNFDAVSKITLPLKTFADVSALNLTLNGTDTDNTNDNLDEITFNYTRRTEYVSRACGYKTLFTLDATNPVVLTNDASNWIQNITVTQPNIENENETHVKIYF
ncbi:DUF6452 family protein [Flavobacterium urocaniciphilum]|uniref:Lipoprotein n=1 Tax=Flavobacterium urocaniciphilum TaxID=1299341 RepID=A0A1H9E8B8_9FLAO|nr:DUF6452 family protein [Flavobacterium urocaniciphilum]SEQ21986.1 hypothetical protein SAMN05444005_11059 [Flavobacterium urocaniciphilum]